MARQLTTKAQVNGYRFLVKRLEHALVRRDVRMLHDPMRSQVRALLVGAVLGVLVLGGCGVWGLIKPQGSVGDAKILVSKNSGGLYVIVDKTLHPVLNLASARLIAGSAEGPTSVSDSKLANYPRGPLLGIPGAPVGLPGSAHRGTSVWAVCDSVTGDTSSSDGGAGAVELTVIGDRPRTSDTIGVATLDDAVLVTDGTTTHLIYQLDRDNTTTSVRARVDTGDVAVMRALGLDGVSPRRISTGLLNTFAEVAPLESPKIDGAGGAGAISAPGVRIGSVVKTVGIDDSDAYYLVLRTSVQRVTEPTAEMIRLADRNGSAPVATVSPGVIAALPTTSALPIGDFPARVPRLSTTATTPVTCHEWSRAGDAPRATTRLLVGRTLPLADDARPVGVTSADGPGPGVDQVYVRPGSGEYLQVTGNEADSRRAESLFYVSDSGVRFGVDNLATGQTLGLGDAPVRAPWSVVSLLATGPTLSRTNALVAHDGMAADPSGQQIVAPGK
ncbi:type VII secretion protein EccB [Gordonia sinesedis]